MASVIKPGPRQLGLAALVVAVVAPLIVGAGWIGALRDENGRLRAQAAAPRRPAPVIVTAPPASPEPSPSPSASEHGPATSGPPAGRTIAAIDRAAPDRGSGGGDGDPGQGDPPSSAPPPPAPPAPDDCPAGLLRAELTLGARTCLVVGTR